MSIKLGVVMDPIQTINYKKDSTLAMLLEAKARGWELFYFEQKDLFLKDGIAYGITQKLSVEVNPTKWFKLEEKQEIPLSTLNVLLMRKDPPFNAEYIYTTYLLEHAERSGVLVVNRPQSLRDANEKLFTTYFPQCCTPSLVTASSAKLHEFWQEHADIVCKPLDSMGGTSVFRLTKEDPNANVIFTMLTNNGKQSIMVQKFIPEIVHGDKRVLLINAEPIPYVLARVPQGNDWRGNLVLGAKGVVQPLTERDKWICQQIAPALRERGLYFVGIDIIGDYLTEINVTSPTGIREIDTEANINCSALLMDFIEGKVKI